MSTIRFGRSDIEPYDMKKDADIDLDDFLEELEGYIEDPEFAWALDTLTGIRDNVSAYDNVTPNQRRAVTNIKNAVERRLERRDAARTIGYQQ